MLTFLWSAISSWWERERLGREFDRRVHRRFSARLPITLRLVGTQMSGILLDLSAGGALLLSNRELPVGSCLSMEAGPLPNLDSLHCGGHVIRRRQTAEGAWECGIRFTRQGDDAYPRLRQYLKQLRFRITPSTGRQAA